MTIDLDDLRRYAVARSLFAPTTLPQAIERLGFVQADPIRAPARAQDLTLRHRVRGYRAGDLERRYPRLAIEEDFFVNYGFVPRAHAGADASAHAAHRVAEGALGAGRTRCWTSCASAAWCIRARSTRTSRTAGRATGAAARRNATTQLLDGMHYRGLLRVARRDGGMRVYAARERARRAAADPRRARWTRWSTWSSPSTRRCRRASLGSW